MWRQSVAESSVEAGDQEGFCTGSGLPIRLWENDGKRTGLRLDDGDRLWLHEGS